MVEAETNVAATSGNLFRCDTNQYLFNWSTKGLASGTYVLRIDLGDGASHTVHVGSPRTTVRNHRSSTSPEAAAGAARGSPTERTYRTDE